MNTTDEQVLTFPKAEARPKPTLICVGNVTEVGDGYISGKSGTDYVVIPITIEALDGGKRAKVYFTHRPEWLTAGFKPYLLQREAPGAYFVYSKNISSEDEFSLLRGLAGSEEAFVQLSTILLNLEVDPEIGGPNPETTTAALRAFFEGNVGSDGQPVRVGYELRQQRTKVLDENGEAVIDPETGKPMYVNENRYNVASFWDVTEKTVSKATNRASRSEGKVIMTFAGSPF
jgi:hypothetical protein